jgi:(E)-4-hydroxy-3-methylbut-2-enyl-diphosphate synthase
MFHRPHKTIPVRCGTVCIGGGGPVVVQSMTKTRTDDVRATVRQVRQLMKAGCELVRVAVPDQAAAAALPEVRRRIALPLVADIHFDYRLALAAVKAGFDKVRINPGNIGSAARVKEVIRAARDHHAAIRVGVNAGSIEKAVLRRHRHPTVAAMIESLEHSLAPFLQLGFQDIVLSAKTTSVTDTIAVYREMSRRFRYPLHVGLTEAGLPFEGAIRSTAALAVLLSEGIGDTIRISLTGDPVLEVQAAWELLAALGARQRGPSVYSCPTCGRTGARVIELTRKVKQALAGVDRPMKVAVMGCVVNGPGEAREADFGIACGAGKGLIFARGKAVCTCPEAELVPALVRLIKAGE